MIKLVIFDLDGVLVDACEWHRVALNQALQEICNYEIPLEEHNSTFNGLPTKEKLKILTKQKLVKRKDYEAISQRKQELTLELIQKKAKRSKKKIDMIKALKKQGIHVACFTNSIRETAELMLKKTGVLDLLEELVTNEDVKKPKPSPEGYLKVIRKFKVPKENVVIIEDSPKGYAAAMAAGCRVYPVANAEGVDIGLFSEWVK
jgi:HAD superfamily hydrolase (TIGR01509 family)